MVKDHLSQHILCQSMVLLCMTQVQCTPCVIHCASLTTLKLVCTLFNKTYPRWKEIKIKHITKFLIFFSFSRSRFIPDFPVNLSATTHLPCLSLLTLINKHLLSSFYVPGSVQGTWDPVVNKKLTMEFVSFF